MFEIVFVIGLLTTWMRPLLSTVAIPATVEATKNQFRVHLSLISIFTSHFFGNLFKVIISN